MATVNKILQKNAPAEQPEPTDARQQWIRLYNSETYIDNSMLTWPNEPQLKKEVNLPLSLAVRLFQPVEPPRASFSKDNLAHYRCFSCKAFINKMCLVVDQKRYDCSICGASNNVTVPLDTDSVELTSMIYEVAASDDNRMFAATPPTMIFVIDISKHNKPNLFNLTFALRQFLKSLPNKDFYQVMIVTFDRYVHYYDFSGEQTSKNIMIDDMHCRADICILSQVEEKLLEVVDSLEESSEGNMFERGTALIEAMEFAAMAGRAYAGRIMVFAKLQGKLPLLSGPMPPGIRPDALDCHRALERRFSKAIQEGRMSLSFFFFSETYIDLLSFYPLARFTNGSVHLYRKGQQLKFYYDLSLLLLSADYYDAQLKVRYSPGIKMIAVFGSYTPMKNANDHIKLYSCSSLRNYVFQFNIQAKINKPYLVAQFSLLFTNNEGMRKFRIINYVIELGDEPMKLLKSVDYSIVNYFYLKASAQTMDTNMEQKTIRTIVQDRFTKHMGFCRQFFADKALAEHIGEYSRITYCILRCKHLTLPFSESPEWDKITQLRSSFLRIGFAQMALNVFPLLYGIDSPEADHDPQSIPILDLTVDCTKDNSIILIDRGSQLLLYLNPSCPKLRTILGDKTLDHFRKNELNDELLNQLADQNEMVGRIVALIAKLRSQKESGYEHFKTTRDISEWLLFSVGGSTSFSSFVNFVVR